MIRAVLFDLDGTLIDTAPDMAASLNAILQQEGYPPLSLDTIRPHVSKGGLALTQLAFAERVAKSEIEPLRQRFLQHYLQHIADHSRLFEGFEHTLQQLEKNHITWGVVTNKPAWLTDPLMQALQLDKRSAITISGDTTAERKPHPLPLQTAAQAINMDCSHCLYIGDDPRDIEAGRAANMSTMIAKYGYIFADTDFSTWRADYAINYPNELLDYL